MKEDQNKLSSQREEETPIPSSLWKKLIKKKWFFPAVYLAAAALILALITWYQNNNLDYALDSDELYESIGYESEGETQEGLTDEEGYLDPDALPVTGPSEEIIWPVAVGDDIQVVLGFFDDEASEEEQLNAMVQYERSFHPNQGIDFAHKDGETFDVVAALSGTVTKADKDPLVGYFVELEHENGLVTVYQGLEDVQVAEGDQVKQGELLGRAGRSIFKQDLGVHVHFQVKENGVPVNPYNFLTDMTDTEETEKEETPQAEEAAREQDDAASRQTDAQDGE
ncbi:Peptidase M23 [Caldalkalibacillus thermarum TA2.A1]|uniref:M23 family metallopeptidase n=1 Tax=Caldalkalibacillus thermarum (strain TA2.A1) TaxID=986075 RepID=F5LA52_CALTT|nr:M23 family metallopeptidase [Caldalkalibacillus thermarum]EGL81772.1 Peptidase M23 [Caldalkalibacillus thermarum TA2.A1]QZT34147.1 M23 family metallopeptidase [Caldalkalibacillus thermarum TA2.A1]